MIVAMIYPRGEGYAGMSSRLILAALTHDLAEIETGDIPATAKWESRELCEALNVMEGKFNRRHDLPQPASYKEDSILKWADTFELCLYSHHQITKGNEYAVEILNNGLEHLRKLGFPTTEAKELYDQVFGRR
jgi:5'-deoxynucleotidase YfbR-like HD superfamily hydrolase